MSLPKDVEPAVQDIALDATGAGPVPVLYDLGPEESLRAGDRVGDYEIERILGIGGAGTVYLAVRRTDGRHVAVKILKRDVAGTKSGVARFLREVETVQRIKHPNIIDIHDIGSLPDGRPYYAMELFQGTNLRTRLAGVGRFSAAEVMPLVEGICAGLSAVHAAGVVHRDIKLDNIMVDDALGVKLVDFGIAKLLEPPPGTPGLTTTLQFLGTPSTMAPEQIRCETIDHRTDIYSLGVVLYYLLTGNPLFRGSAEDVIRAHLSTPPRPPSSQAPLSPAVDAVVLRCLEKEPGARYQSIAALLADFRAAALVNAVPTQGSVGIGILVRAHPQDPADQDALAEAVLTLDDAEAALRAEGMQVVVQTSSEVMGVLVAPSEADAELTLRHRVADCAQRLRDALRNAVQAGVRVYVTVHSDAVQVRAGTEEVVGGLLLDLERWGPAVPGVSLTLPLAPIDKI